MSKSFPDQMAKHFHICKCISFAISTFVIKEKMGSCIIFTLIFHTKYTMLMSSTIVVSEETDLDGGEGRNIHLMQYMVGAIFLVL